jgi:ABC-type multidrug transport system fused ATPase/permease subunit
LARFGFGDHNLIKGIIVNEKHKKMDRIGYKLTDWIFIFKEKNKTDLNNILSYEKNVGLADEFITWKLITVFLPLLTFLLVFVLNVIINICQTDKYLSFFNNGSLPIISFGILTSGMPFLLEVLENQPDYHIVRRRVMSIAMFFLFLSATLYILQTLSIVQNNFSLLTNLVLATLSVFVFFSSNSIGYKMFLLQSKHIPPFDEKITKGVKNLSNSVDDLE